MVRSEPALTAMAGAMVGLAMAVAAVLAERWPSAGRVLTLREWPQPWVAGVKSCHLPACFRCEASRAVSAVFQWQLARLDQSSSSVNARVELAQFPPGGETPHALGLSLIDALAEQYLWRRVHQ